MVVTCCDCGAKINGKDTHHHEIVSPKAQSALSASVFLVFIFLFRREREKKKYPSGGCIDTHTKKEHAIGFHGMMRFSEESHGKESPTGVPEFSPWGVEAVGGGGGKEAQLLAFFYIASVSFSSLLTVVVTEGEVAPPPTTTPDPEGSAQLWETLNRYGWTSLKVVS